MDGIMVFENAEILFGSRTHRTSSIQTTNDIANLMFHIHKFAGIVILITNSIDSIDVSVLNTVKFIVDFKKPDHHLRFVKIPRNFLFLFIFIYVIIF